MDLEVVVLIVVGVWVGLSVLVLAMCKAASHADEREQTLERRRVAHPVTVERRGIPSPKRRVRRPHFHGVHLHRG